MSKDPKTVPAKLREFFKRNPDEELTTDDIRVKFDLNERQLHDLLHYLRKRGEIEVETVRIVRPLPTVDAS